MKRTSEEPKSLKEIHRVRKELWTRWKDMSYDEIKKEISGVEERILRRDHPSLSDVQDMA